MRLETGGSTTLTVTDVSLTANVASGSTVAYGGGVFAYQGSTTDITLDRVTTYGNVVYSTYAGGAGGYLEGGSGGALTLSGCTVASNSAYNTSGTRMSGAGGGLYVSTAGPDVTVDRCSIYGNDAGSGDGILVATQGAAVFEVANSDVFSNGTTGIMHYAYDTTSGVVLTDSRVYDHLSYGLYLVAEPGYAANLECTGSSALTAGVYANGDYGIAGACTVNGGNCYLVATVCDLGLEGTDADNGYADLAIDAYALDGCDDDETFRCVNALCL